jgi:dTDP-4-dehydrorhamnose reductase
MLKLAQQQPKLRVVADQIGSPTLARMVADATAAFLASELRLPRTPSGVYHLTAQGSTSWHGFATRIVEGGADRGLCPRVPVEPLTSAEYPTPAKRPAWSVLDCSQFAQLTGIAIPRWEEGLQQCLDELVREC